MNVPVPAAASAGGLSVSTLRTKSKGETFSTNGKEVGTNPLPNNILFPNDSHSASSLNPC